jgi:hypothetical protein
MTFFKHHISLCFRQGNFRNGSEQKTLDIALIDTVWNEHMSELNTRISESYNTIVTSTNIHENITDNYFLPYEELMDLLLSPAETIESTYKHDEKNIDTVRNDC